MTPSVYIPGLDDPSSAPRIFVKPHVETLEKRLLHYGFTHEQIEQEFAEIEAYAKKGRH